MWLWGRKLVGLRRHCVAWCPLTGIKRALGSGNTHSSWVLLRGMHTLLHHRLLWRHSGTHLIRRH